MNSVGYVWGTGPITAQLQVAITADDSAGGDQSDAAKTKWEQYLYYYKRYHGHEEAQKFAVSATCTPCPTNNMKTKY